MNQQIIATPELEGPVRSETRDGMRIDWDVPIPMDDGLVLRADVYRPLAEGRYPVIMSYGPYAKLLQVGLNGISYYAINQWQVASLQPKHLAAICLWEG